jgi:tetratricopeptide (TPR) repeat protein
MKVPFRLRRIAQARPATALLLPGHDCAALLSACARLGHVAWPAVFTVHDGFLLRFQETLREPVGGTIRLAELANSVLLPVDAELVPGLLPDEAMALGRERGLIFLPEGRVLAFAPKEPIPLEQLLHLGNLTGRSWQPLDQPSGLAERLVSITLDLPDPPPETIIEAGGEGIGEEAPRPDAAPVSKQIAGRAGMGLGKALAWLGKALGSQKLAKLGGKLMAASMNLVPRLTEKLLGKQEAGLRQLLKYFQSGDVEKALRHAIPIGGNAPGGVVPGGTDLPLQDTRYSLAAILGGAGPASAWFTPDELFRQLEREYRRQAEAAAKRGDYRRAAFIYGKLLADYHMAAAVLGQGGLHHDAAIIYLHRLGDHFSAAREFEAAGELDRALQLYRQKNEHVRAGDLLRRMGEEELAVAEYKAAADRMVAHTRGYFQAGDLMLQRAQRPDLARGYFEAGWDLREEVAALGCAKRLAQLHAEGGERDALLRLVGEAEEHLAPPGNEGGAGEFFNHVAALSSQPNLQAVREELRDRALLGLANKLRQRGTGAVQLVPALFAPGTVWETAVVTDAQFAVKAPIRRAVAPPSARPAPGAIVTNLAEPSVVRAVCQAAQTAELFLGFENGAVVRYDPARGEVHYIDGQPGSVLGLAVNHDGSMLVVYSSDGVQDHLACYLRRHEYKLAHRRSLGAAAERRLFPVAQAWTTLLWDSVRGVCVALDGPRLLVESEIRFETDPGFIFFRPHGGDQSLLAFDGREMSYIAPVTHVGDGRGYFRVLCPFPVRNEKEHPLGHPPLSWRTRGIHILEVVGIGPGGSLGWMELAFRESGALMDTAVLSAPGPFHAAVLYRPQLIAAITSDAVVWLRPSPQGIREVSRQKVQLPPALACFPHEFLRELIVVAADGSLFRVPVADHNTP